MNKITILGNLTRDPELRFTPSGTAIAQFGIAHNHRFSDKDGNKKEEVLFVDVTAFGKQGETISQWFKKGSRILIEGRLKLDQWEDKQTREKRSKLGIVLEAFHFIDKAIEGGERQERTAPRTMSKRLHPDPEPAPAPVEDEDFPF